MQYLSSLSRRRPRAPSVSFWGLAASTLGLVAMPMPTGNRSRRRSRASSTPSCARTSCRSAWCARSSSRDGRPRRRRRLADDARLPDPLPLRDGRPAERRARSTASSAVNVGFDVLSPDEKQALQQRLGRGALPEGALAAVKNVICVGSGKGGVGKSTVTANLAAALQMEGKSAAALDADVWGYSIPRMLGVHGRPTVSADAQDHPARRRRRRQGDLDRVLPRGARTRRSPGAGRCCTRRSASSSRTSTGASSTTC